MGIKFGTIPVRIRGIVFYTLTGFEQKYWAHFLSQTVPNAIRTVKECVVPMIPVIPLGVWTIQWGTKENKRLKRKDPKKYENDK